VTENNNERATRDMAVRAEAKTDAHLIDCAAYRLRLADELKGMKRDIGQDTNELKSDIADIKMDLKKQTKIITLITGGMLALSKVPELLSFFHL
jgi:hypothetical protein